LAQLLTDSTKRKQLQLGAQSAAQNLPKWKDSAQIVFQLIQLIHKSQEVSH